MGLQAAINAVGVNGQPVEKDKWRYDPRTTRLTVSVCVGVFLKRASRLID